MKEMYQVVRMENGRTEEERIKEFWNFAEALAFYSKTVRNAGIIHFEVCYNLYDDGDWYPDYTSAEGDRYSIVLRRFEVGDNYVLEA